MSTQHTAAQGQCPKCDATNLYQWLVCSICGARLPWADTITKVSRIVSNQPAPSVAPAASAGDTTGLAAIIAAPYFRYIVLGVVLIAAALVYSFMQSVSSHQLTTVGLNAVHN